MSTERTFREMSAAEEQLSLCRELCEDLAEDMKKEGLKGKTVTLKLKNVNFEVKTRAWTLPYAVATVDEIFAVAKDLLKTEIENVSPQLLRLRLMGVRISAFVSTDDKTPLQKSIVGFLKQSKADSGGPSQHVCQKPGKELLVNGSTQSGPLACPPVVEKGQKQGEVHWLAKQRGSEVTQIRGQQQQSFFQRAHAQRLRLQAESANKQEERHGDSPSVITSTGIHIDKSEGSPTKAHESERRFTFSGKREALPNTENVSVLPLEAHASTLERSGTDSESLTCPVCCRQVKTSNLYVFNKHIDQCLSNVSTKLDPNTDTDSDSDMEPEKGHQGCEVMDDEREECDAKKEKEREKVEQSKDSSVIETSEPTINESEDISEQGPFEPDESHYDHTGPVLICPICQVSQDTDDLTVFNCHVDVCLNQDVLHELRGQTSLTTDLPSVTVTNSNVTEREQPLPRHANKGKIKRRGSPTSPPSKKARGPGRHNTIDKFFKRQTSYTQNVPPHRK